MKKLLCAVLSILMMLALCAPAFAESGYEAVVDMLGRDYRATMPIEGDPGERLNMLFSIPDSCIMLFGKNADGTPECSYWIPNDVNALYQIYSFLLFDYAGVQEKCDEGITFALGIMFTADSEPVYVGSEEDAKALLEYLASLEQAAIDAASEEAPAEVPAE